MILENSVFSEAHKEDKVVFTLTPLGPAKWCAEGHYQKAILKRAAISSAEFGAVLRADLVAAAVRRRGIRCAYRLRFLEPLAPNLIDSRRIPSSRLA